MDGGALARAEKAQPDRLDSTKTIYDTVSGSQLKVLSSEAYSKHGYKPSCVIFDELHAQPNRDLWDVMTFGAGDAREMPVWIVLTTAGDDPDRKSIGWEVHEKALSILRCREGRAREGDMDRPALAADRVRPWPDCGRGRAEEYQHLRRGIVAALQPLDRQDGEAQYHPRGGAGGQAQRGGERRCSAGCGSASGLPRIRWAGYRSRSTTRRNGTPRGARTGATR